MMYFRDLEQSDLDEIKNLHREWFPLEYPDKFYGRVLHKEGVIAIGCFLELPRNVDGEQLDKSEDEEE